MIEGISVEVIEVALDKVVMIGKIKSVTLTTGKRIEMDPESSAEGGVITLDRAIAKTQSSAGIAENPATTKRSAERRNVRQTDN
jgi:hypothetical protein